MTVLSDDYLRQCFCLDQKTGRIVWAERPMSHFVGPAYWAAWNRRFSGRPISDRGPQLTIQGEKHYYRYDEIAALLGGTAPTPRTLRQIPIAPTLAERSDALLDRLRLYHPAENRGRCVASTKRPVVVAYNHANERTLGGVASD